MIIQCIILKGYAQNDSLLKLNATKNNTSLIDSIPKKNNKPEIPNNPIISELKGMRHLNDSNKVSEFKNHVNKDSIKSTLK